jgi:hypothetical protein
MTTHEFLQQLRTQDVRVWADGDRLRMNAPHGLLTPELQAELASRKESDRFRPVHDERRVASGKFGRPTSLPLAPARRSHRVGDRYGIAPGV